MRHLQQRDHGKLEKLTASMSERNKAKTEILRDIYGEQKGKVYEYGLAKSLNKQEILKKFDALKVKWEGLCPGFHEWFARKKSGKFQNSVICTAREGTNVAGLYFQNEIESLHFVEKKRQNLTKENVLKVIEGLKSHVCNQRVEETRALHGAGRYELSTAYKKFFVDSS